MKTVQGQYSMRLVPMGRFAGGSYRGQTCWGPVRSDGCTVAVAGRRVTNLVNLRIRVRTRS